MTIQPNPKWVIVGGGCLAFLGAAVNACYLIQLGTNLGMKLKGHQIARWKLWVPTLLVLCFFAGAVFGSTLVIALNRPALLILAGIYIAGGIGWSLYKHVFLARMARE